MAHTFSREEKLKSKKLIEMLFREGKSFSVSPIKVIFLCRSHPLPIPVQAGFSVPISRFPHATDRNRIKRQTREAWRLQKHVLNEALGGRPLQLAVFLIITPKKKVSFQAVQDKISVILKRLIAELPPAPGQGG